MVKEKKILITFDYELFLGKRSGSVNKCLIQPTNRLLEVLEKNKITAIFFVDLTYLVKLNNIKNQYLKALKDWETIAEQINEIIYLKHYIFYHIHPHWLDAVYDHERNEWDLSNKSKFSVSNLNDNQIDKLFKDCYEILKLLKIEEQSIGYRAGGLYIQPFHKLKPFFEKYNIKYDFSVLQGASSLGDTKNFYFDFKNCPDNLIYNFEDDIIKENKNGDFTEISINQIQIKGVFKIINGFYFRVKKNNFKNKRIGDGIATNNKINQTNKINFIKYFKVKETFSIELMNPIRNIIYFNHLKKNNFQHHISHPKFFSENNIKYFEKYLRKINTKFIIVSDFKKMI